MQPVGAGDHVLEVIPAFFPEEVQGLLAAGHGLAELLPEDLRALPAFEDVDVDLVAHLLQDRPVGHRPDRLGQLQGDEAGDEDAFDLPGGIGRRLVDDDALLAPGAELFPDGRGLDVEEVGVADRVRLGLEIGESEDAVGARIGAGHEVRPGDRRDLGQARFHLVDLADIHQPGHGRHDPAAGQVDDHAVGHAVEADDTGPIRLLALQDGHDQLFPFRKQLFYRKLRVRSTVFGLTLARGSC